MRIDKLNKSNIKKNSILQHNTVKGPEMRSYYNSHHKINGAVQYNTAQHSTEQTSIIQYSTVQ